MTALAIKDLSHASSNAVLTAQASKVISRALRGGGPLDERSHQIVERAGEFLTRIVEGSLLVENKDVAGFAPSHENLREYVRALSAVESLNQVSQDASFANMFVKYRQCLIHFGAGQIVPNDDLQRLRNFFGTLSSLFFAELTRPGPDNTQGDHLQTMS